MKNFGRDGPAFKAFQFIFVEMGPASKAFRTHQVM